jgi:hypothetical protein
VLPLQLTAGLTQPSAGCSADETENPIRSLPPTAVVGSAIRRLGGSDPVEAPASCPRRRPLWRANGCRRRLEAGPFVAGEAEAQPRLAAFVEGVSPPLHQYAERRNSPEVDGTSGLSPYLRFGMLPAAAGGVGCLCGQGRGAARRGGGAESRVDQPDLVTSFTLPSCIIFRMFAGKLSSGLRPDCLVDHPEQFRAWCGGQTG